MNPLLNCISDRSLSLFLPNYFLDMRTRKACLNRLNRSKFDCKIVCFLMSTRWNSFGNQEKCHNFSFCCVYLTYCEYNFFWVSCNLNFLAFSQERKKFQAVRKCKNGWSIDYVSSIFIKRIQIYKITISLELNHDIYCCFACSIKQRIALK